MPVLWHPDTLVGNVGLLVPHLSLATAYSSMAPRDFADLLESAGEVTRALAVWMELQSTSSGFRDVKMRVARLSKAQARG